jgi:hypothetical protein
MGRTRRKHLPDDYVRRLLAHWHGTDVDSYVDDFRHADRESYETPEGYTVERQGRPSPVEPIGDTDGKAQDFDAEEYITLGDDDRLDPAAGDSLTVLTLLEAGPSAQKSRVFCSTDTVSTGMQGWGQLIDSAGGLNFVIGDGSDRNTASGNGTLDDGSPHLATNVVDRGVDKLRNFIDASPVRTEDISAVGDASNSLDKVVGALSDGSEGYPGILGLAVWHPEWISQPQLAYLYEILTDRTTYAHALDRWVYGTPETGLKRRPIDYLERAGIWSTDGAAWDCRRSIHHVDGEGVVQVENHMGPWEGKHAQAQRTDSEQAIARGASERGEPLDYAELTGTERAYNTSFPSSYTTEALCLWGVARRAANSDLYIPDRFEGSSTSTIVDLRLNDDTTVGGHIQDADGSGPGGLAPLLSDTTTWTAWILTTDTSSDRVRLVAKNAAGDRGEDKYTAAGFTGSLTVDVRKIFSGQTTGVSDFDGDFQATGWAPVSLDDATQDALLDDLARVHF